MAWQYCEVCGSELNPTDEDVLVGIIKCRCETENQIVAMEDRQREILIEMYRDIQNLKDKLL